MFTITHLARHSDYPLNYQVTAIENDDPPAQYGINITSSSPLQRAVLLYLEAAANVEILPPLDG